MAEGAFPEFLHRIAADGGSAMKKAVLALVISMLCATANASGPVYVRGHVTKSGTYVAPHYRSSPNKSSFDNYSTKGNYNPYTGKSGTQNAYPSSSGYYPVPSAPTVPSAPRYYSAPARSQALTSAYRYAAPAQTEQPRYRSSSNMAIGSPPHEIYRCDGADGLRHYVSYPRAGCVFVTDYSVQPSTAAARPAYAAPPPTQVSRYFSGWGSSRGSGHDAGREWAQRKGIDDPDDCGGNSNSFIEGCRDYAEELQQEQAEDE